MARRTKVTKKDKKGKPTFLLPIIYLLALLIIISLAQAVTWTQYTPSPTTAGLVYVLSLPNGYAYAIASGGTNCFLYNTTWQEVQCASATINLTNYTYYNTLDYISTSEIFLLYKNNTGGGINGSSKIIKYNTYTNSYTTYYTTTAGMFRPYTLTFSCVRQEDICYLSPAYPNYGVYQFYPTLQFLMNFSYVQHMMHSNYKTMIVDTASPYHAKEWNGISFIDRGGYTEGVKHLYNTALNRAFPSKGGSGRFHWYNYTTGLFYYSSIISSGITDITDINGEIHFIYVTQIRKIAWNSNTYSTSLTNASGGLNSIDYNPTSGMGWAVGNGGIIYQYNGTGAGAVSITQSAIPNPVTYLSTSTWLATPTHSLGYQSNVTLTISGACISAPQSSTWLNVLSGTTITYPIDTTYPQFIENANCTLHTTANFTNGDDATASDINFRISPAYTLTLRIDPQPTIYGNQVIFYGKATHSSGVNSNLTIEIWDNNFSTLYHTNTVSNVTNDVETELFRLNINSPSWTTFPVGNYTYNLIGTLINNNFTGADYTSWNVIVGEMINQTAYTMTCNYKDPEAGLNGIYSLTQYDENHAYTSIQNGSHPYIASWDTTNPSDIKYSRLNTALDQQSGRNGNPSSISAIDMTPLSDVLYIGTDDDLFIYTNASQKKAENLVYNFDKGFGIWGNDGIIDVSQKSADYTYVCQDGTFPEDDDIYLYNNTLADFQDKMNMNPCQSIKYDGWIYGHRGYDRDVQIWNTNTSLASTIDFTKIISTRTFHDLIDTNGDYLSFIAGKDEIRRYNIANKTNPTLAGKCFTKYTNEEIESIEAINNNEIIIGAYTPTPYGESLYVCDFGNNDTYNAIKGGYEAQELASGLLGDRIWEITKNNDEGKISVAMGDKYNVCFYEKTNESITINNPPIIDNYTFTPTPPICKNQQIEIEIFAHDPDINDTISSYGVSCAGGGQPTTWSANNLKYCSYSTFGTKTITIIVKDNHGLQSTATYDTIQVNDCTMTNSTTLYFKITSGTTTTPIEGATISIYDNLTYITQGTTNNNGYADFTGLTPNILYRVTFVANNYAPKTRYFHTSNSRYLEALEPTIINETQRTLLIVTVTYNNTPIETALVSTLDPITGSSKYGLTDYTGTVYLFDIQPSTAFIVGAKKEGYTTTSIYTSIGAGEQKIVTITMGISLGPGGYFPATERHCADTISGVWLCGNLSVTGTGSSCAQDTDCISGRCSFAVTPSARECSKFNYTLCDVQGINRGNTCIFRNMTRGIFTMIGNMILGNFLWVLLLVLLIVAGLIIRRSLHH